MASPEAAASIKLRNVRAIARDAQGEGNGGLTDAEVGNLSEKKNEQ